LPAAKPELFRLQWRQHQAEQGGVGRNLGPILQATGGGNRTTINRNKKDFSDRSFALRDAPGISDQAGGQTRHIVAA
jgi:hypothetical protein